MTIYPIRKAWSQWLTVLGFLILATVTPTSGAPLLFPPWLWVTAASVVATAGAWAAATMVSLTAHRVWVSLTVAFALLRIVDFVTVGRWPGVGVWVAVLGLSVSKYRAVARILGGRT